MGTSLNGLTPAGTYPGLIKTGDNAPIDGTLKTLSDGNGNNLPMAVSTTAVNFTGTLTQGGTTLQPTLVSGTNIKTINGTSVLGSGNIAVVTSPSGVAGAIQFSNGSAFASDATNLFWDDTNNRLGIGTNAPTTSLQIDYASSTLNGILINQTGGTNNFSNIGFANGGTIKATLGVNLNSGEVRLSAFPGGYFPTIYSNGSEALRIDTSGNTGIGINAPTARLHIKGSGSTSATTSLLVQNSAGTDAFKVLDSGDVLIKDYLRPADGTSNSFVRLSNAQGTFLQYASGFIVLNPNFQYQSTSYGDILFMSSTTGQFLLNGGTLENSAQMQINATTKGFLPPRMTTTQKNAIATPAAGLVVYDNTTNKLCCYNGSTWNDLF